MPLPITSFYVGLLALFFLAISFRVSLGRVKHRVSLGEGGSADLLRRVRTQANAAEYLPLALIVIALIEGAAAPAWVVHLFGAALAIGRVFHAYAISVEGAPQTFRMVGTLLTWAVLFFGGLGLVGHALIGGAAT